MLADGYDELDPERQRLDLQYRHRLEFAIGRTASVTWAEGFDADSDSLRRATSVETTWLPTADVPQTVAGHAGEAVTAMRVLMDLQPEGVDEAFRPLVDGYRVWLDTQSELAAELPTHLKEIADEAIGEAGLVDRSARGRPRAPQEQPAGTASFPVHEPDHARPAHALAGRRETLRKGDALD